MAQDSSKRKQVADLKQGTDLLRSDKAVLRHTGEIIAAVYGEFLSNRNTPVRHSPNAGFGRSLRQHAQELGIAHVRAHVRVVDSDGHKTHASLWRIDPY